MAECISKPRSFVKGGVKIELGARVVWGCSPTINSFGSSPTIHPANRIVHHSTFLCQHPTYRSGHPRLPCPNGSVFLRPTRSRSSSLFPENYSPPCRRILISSAQHRELPCGPPPARADHPTLRRGWLPFRRLLPPLDEYPKNTPSVLDQIQLSR